jgi:hypothetical protein
MTWGPEMDIKVRFAHLEISPFAPTQQKTVTRVRRFLTALEYSPIGVKFLTSTAPRTPYIVKKKKWKIVQTFWFFKSLYVPK